MSDKPSFLGLLNAIVVGEARAERYLLAWAEVTPHDDVRDVLRTVAVREGEHAKAFEKRIVELGYWLRPSDDDESEALAVARSTELTDVEKLDHFRLGQAEPDGDDVFTRMFADPTIDPVTGGLLGRYIAEERDTGRLLFACRSSLLERAAA